MNDAAEPRRARSASVRAKAFALAERPWAAYAAFFLLMAGPALFSGGALWFDDIGPYAKGGHVALETVGDLFERAPSGSAPAAAGAVGAATLADAAPSLAPEQVSGARSIAYSVFAASLLALLGNGLLIVVVQAGVIAGLLTAIFKREPIGLGGLLLVCAATSAPFVASGASPDVWAGIMLLAWLVLQAYGRRLTIAEFALAGAAIVFAVAAHASHIPLAAALAAGSVGLAVVSRAGLKPALWAGGAVAAGIAGTVATGVIGFGEVSLAPKRYPITLARSVADGPGLWHLEEHCDTYNYAVCEVFGEDIPDNVGDFLWNEGGIRALATPEQMDRVRAEEAIIVTRAMREYPFAQVRRAASNSWEQFWLVEMRATPGGRIVSVERPGEVRPAGDRWHLLPGLLIPIHYAAFVISLVGAVAIFVTPARRHRAAPLIALALIGLAANAVVCGALSVPVHRYQARIVWVLPIAMAVWGLPALRTLRFAGSFMRSAKTA